MSDDIFKQSEKRRAEIDAGRKTAAKKEYAQAQAHNKKVTTNAKTINQYLRNSLEYFSEKQMPSVKRNNYDIEHDMRCDSSVRSDAPQPQYVSSLFLYMNRGSLLRTMDINLPYKARHIFCMLGNEQQGKIEIGYIENMDKESKIGEIPLTEQIDTALLDKHFESFLLTAMSNEEESH